MSIFGIFYELLSTQNVNVVRCAHNVEWDFFCDFQTLCFGVKMRQFWVISSYYPWGHFWASLSFDFLWHASLKSNCDVCLSIHHIIIFFWGDGSRWVIFSIISAEGNSSIQTIAHVLQKGRESHWHWPLFTAKLKLKKGISAATKVN